jgi:hypothetical protein
MAASTPGETAKPSASSDGSRSAIFALIGTVVGAVGTFFGHYLDTSTHERDRLATSTSEHVAAFGEILRQAQPTLTGKNDTASIISLTSLFRFADGAEDDKLKITEKKTVILVAGNLSPNVQQGLSPLYNSDDDARNLLTHDSAAHDAAAVFVNATKPTPPPGSSRLADVATAPAGSITAQILAAQAKPDVEGWIYLGRCTAQADRTRERLDQYSTLQSDGIPKANDIVVIGHTLNLRQNEPSASYPSRGNAADALGPLKATLGPGQRAKIIATPNRYSLNSNSRAAVYWARVVLLN